MGSNNFFQRMTKEAMDDLAGGEKGWREADPNTLILACFGMLYNHFSHKVTKPLWFFVSVVAAGVIWMIISSVLGIE